MCLWCTIRKAPRLPGQKSRDRRQSQKNSGNPQPQGTRNQTRRDEDNQHDGCPQSVHQQARGKTHALLQDPQKDRRLQLDTRSKKVSGRPQSIHATPLVLVALDREEPLLLYITATPYVVNTTVVVEREEPGHAQKVQRPIYYISKVLSDSKTLILPRPKTALHSPHHVKETKTFFQSNCLTLRGFVLHHQVSMALQLCQSACLGAGRYTTRLACLCGSASHQARGLGAATRGRRASVALPVLTLGG